MEKKPQDRDSKRLLESLRENKSSLDKTSQKIKALKKEILSIQNRADAEKSRAKKKI